MQFELEDEQGTACYTRSDTKAFPGYALTEVVGIDTAIAFIKEGQAELSLGYYIFSEIKEKEGTRMRDQEVIDARLLHSRLTTLTTVRLNNDALYGMNHRIGQYDESFSAYVNYPLTYLFNCHGGIGNPATFRRSAATMSKITISVNTSIRTVASAESAWDWDRHLHAERQSLASSSIRIPWESTQGMVDFPELMLSDNGNENNIGWVYRCYGHDCTKHKISNVQVTDTLGRVGHFEDFKEHDYRYHRGHREVRLSRVVDLISEEIDLLHINSAHISLQTCLVDVPPHFQARWTGGNDYARGVCGNHWFIAPVPNENKVTEQLRIVWYRSANPYVERYITKSTHVTLPHDFGHLDQCYRTSRPKELTDICVALSYNGQAVVYEISNKDKRCKQIARWEGVEKISWSSNYIKVVMCHQPPHGDDPTFVFYPVGTVGDVDDLQSYRFPNEDSDICATRSDGIKKQCYGHIITSYQGTHGKVHVCATRDETKRFKHSVIAIPLSTGKPDCIMRTSSLKYPSLLFNRDTGHVIAIDASQAAVVSHCLNNDPGNPNNPSNPNHPNHTDPWLTGP